MLRKPELFWADERGAPLLDKNRGFLIEGDLNENLIERASKWPSYFEFDPTLQVDFDLATMVDEPQRIHIKDAERTFFGDENRRNFSQVLSYINKNFGDYAQGVSFVTSFLMLFLPIETVLKIILHLNKNDKYLPGYWKTESVASATDANVFEHLLGRFNPKIQKHLQTTQMFPETYAQKWFVGLGVHVLPFEALFLFFENFFQKGYPFLFQFGISLVTEIEDALMNTTKPNELYALLRLADKIQEERAIAIVRNAEKINISDVDFKVLRQETFETKLKARMEDAARRAKQAEEEEEEEEEEEGVECGICHEMIPDYFCPTCNVLLCENCHQHSKENHKTSHKVKSMDQIDYDSVVAGLNNLSLNGNKD